MNYELAKELKDAGFPGSQYWHEGRGGFSFNGEEVPTLSELIEACGDRFGSLYLYNENNLSPAEKESLEIYVYKNGWTPVKEWRTNNSKGHGYWKGSTPEEAVTRLLLALRAKR